MPRGHILCHGKWCVVRTKNFHEGGTGCSDPHEPNKPPFSWDGPINQSLSLVFANGEVNKRVPLV